MAKATSTKERLIQVAQQAFADLGINGASLRRISEMAGTKNVMAAQYHFGSREKLIAAIVEVNRKRLEASRRALCGDDVATLMDMTPQDLFRLVVAPFMARDGDGTGESFVRFLRALVQYAPYNDLWSQQPASTPFTWAIYDALRRSAAGLDDRRLQMRMNLVGKMIVNAIADHNLDADRSSFQEAVFLDDLVEVATAVLSAPVPRANSIAPDDGFRAATARMAAGPDALAE